MNQEGKEELEDLVAGCLEGNRLAQQKVYRLLYGKMMAVCMRYAKDRDEAKDVLQDGFIKVFSNLAKYNGKGSFEGWVRRIIVNTAIDSFRKTRSHTLMVDSEYVDRMEDEMIEEEEDLSVNHIETKVILAEVQKLSPAYRTVFNLYVVEGYSHKEIADQLGISIGTSKSNLSKAKLNLKRAFKHILKYNDY